MDCNNNDGTNYVYQNLQQPMNSTMNGMMNNINSPMSSNIQQQQSIPSYDKKQQYDLSTSNNSVYLNGHNSVTPPISNNSLSNNIPNMSTNLSSNGHPTYNNQPYNAHPPITSPPATSITPPNRINQQYPDYNSFNGSSYYNNYDRNLNYNQMSSINHLNHPTNHPSINQVQSKDNRQIHQMPYLTPNDQQGNSTTSTNQIYNPHHPNHQLNNLHHHVLSPQTSLSATHHQTPQSSPVVQHHLPTVNNQQSQILPQHHSNQNIRPHGNPINHHPINNTNLTNYPSAQTYHQQHLNQFNSSNNLPNSNNSINSSPSTNYQPGYDQNYYNYGHNDQWRFQQIQKNNNSPSLVSQPSSNSQLQNSLNQPSMQSDQKVAPNLNNATNLNNSTNLSQPYSNMHISGNNPMNNSINSSLNNSPMTPSNNSTPINNQQLPPNHQFHPNQTPNQSTNYMSMNNIVNSNIGSGISNYYQTNSVDNHHVQQQNNQPQQYLSSPRHQSQPNTNINLNIQIQQNQQYHQSQMQQIPSPQLTTLQNANTSTNIDSKKFTSQKQKAPSLKSTKSNNSSFSALDETLDSVVNGTIKAKRRRGKGKATKDKVKKETKATSAYALFFKKVQEDIKRKSPKMAFGEISKTVASQWNQLSDDKKQSFKLITNKERQNKLEELAKEKAMKVVSGCKSDPLDHNFCNIKDDDNFCKIKIEENNF